MDHPYITYYTVFNHEQIDNGICPKLFYCHVILYTKLGLEVFVVIFKFQYNDLINLLILIKYFRIFKMLSLWGDLC